MNDHDPQAAHQAKKRFGQNFLHDPQVIARIIRAINPQAGDVLVEIGPGLGALSAPLLEKLSAWNGTLHVVELDRDVIPHLREATGHTPKLQITMADALTVDYRQFAAPGKRLRLVGNLPYNISTPILFHLLEQAESICDMHFMLQKEVVERMCAGPGDDDYGRLSVALAARCEVAHLFNVGPGAFRPAPKVDSAIVRVRPRRPDYPIDDLALFDRVIALAFAQRRKTLSNALKTIADADTLRAAGLDPTLRAERVDARTFAQLANLLHARARG